MPRIGRVMLAGYPHHIVQRGHNRQVVFAAPRDYMRYLDTLAVQRGQLERADSWTNAKTGTD
jgi:hypothetical protein